MRALKKNAFPFTWLWDSSLLFASVQQEVKTFPSVWRSLNESSWREDLCLPDWTYGTTNRTKQTARTIENFIVIAAGLFRWSFEVNRHRLSSDKWILSGLSRLLYAKLSSSNESYRKFVITSKFFVTNVYVLSYVFFDKNYWRGDILEGFPWNISRAIRN